MSYILEALRKAERERSLGQVPTIDHAADAAVPSERRNWMWIVALALLVNAGVLAAWLWPDQRTGSPVQTATREVPLPSAPEPAVRDYIPPPTTIVEEPIEEAPIAPEPLPFESPEPLIPPPAARPAPVEMPEPEPELEPDIAEVPAMEDSGTPPALRDMPAEFRRNLPEMKVDAHFYTDVPGRSFAMINLRKYKAGERLSEGPQVVEIVPDGVVLESQGQRFLLTP